MTTHSSVLAWRIPWTEEPGKLQSMGSQRVGHDRSDLAHTHEVICQRIFFLQQRERSKCCRFRQLHSCRAFIAQNNKMCLIKNQDDTLIVTKSRRRDTHSNPRKMASASLCSSVPPSKGFLFPLLVLSNQRLGSMALLLYTHVPALWLVKNDWR